MSFFNDLLYDLSYNCDMKNKFSVRLSEYIVSTGLSKRKFAESVGVSAMSISDWTNGKIQPNAESIYLICKTYHISADYLLGLIDEPFFTCQREENTL